jgi:hypothetical protein
MRIKPFKKGELGLSTENKCRLINYNITETLYNTKMYNNIKERSNSIVVCVSLLLNTCEKCHCDWVANKIIRTFTKLKNRFFISMSVLFNMSTPFLTLEIKCKWKLQHWFIVYWSTNIQSHIQNFTDTAMLCILIHGFV